MNKTTAVPYSKNSMNALTRVRKYFPGVNSVKDAKKSIMISVIKEDSVNGKRRVPNDCALARACTRSGKADAAIIGIGFCYLIKGDEATRYATSVSVGREITSFDRHQDFAIGKDYVLSKVAPTARLGSARSRKRKKDRKLPPASTMPEPEVHRHHTSRIRVAKGKESK